MNKIYKLEVKEYLFKFFISEVINMDNLKRERYKKLIEKRIKYKM